MRVEIVVLSLGYVRVEQRDWMVRVSRDGRYGLAMGHGNRKPVCNNRNRIAQRFLQGEADYLLMLDEDVVPQGNPLDYVELEPDVMVFPCPIWCYGHSKSKPIAWNIGLENEAGAVLDGRIPQRRRVVDIAEGGTGCILIHRRVLAHPAMRHPFAEVTDEDGVSVLGHDLSFCQRAREAGFRVQAALDCPCAHYDEVELGTVQDLLMEAEAAAAGAFTAPVVALLEKRLIYCCAPGRCGTGYLARVLDSIEGVWAGHEPLPNFVDALRLAQSEEGAAYRFWVEKKLPRISAIQEAVYAETSHCFNKGFVEPLLNLGLLPDLVILRRPHREVAVSMWRRGAIPGRTEIGRRYHVQPDDPGVFLPGWERWERWTDYQVCYWYCLEMEARARRYGPMLRGRGARMVETTLAEMTTREGMGWVLGELGLEGEWADPGVVNRNPAIWDEVWPEGDLDEMEREIEEQVGGYIWQT